MMKCVGTGLKEFPDCTVLFLVRIWELPYYHRMPPRGVHSSNGNLSIQIYGMDVSHEICRLPLIVVTHNH